MAARTEDDRKKRRRRRNGLVEFGNVILTFVVLAILAVGGIVYIGLQQFAAAGPKVEETAFIVEKGNGLNTIANRLAEQGLIDNPLLFRAGAFVAAREATVLPGQYTIPPRASMADILKLITEGKPVEFFVTVPEGETSFQAAERIRLASNSLTGDLPADPAEGTILPGRYDWTLPTDTRQSVLDQMQAAMSKELADIWAARDTSIDDVIKTPAELLTLASLVEKETSLTTERATVASVFINRLRKGMRLQTDPSVLYGVTMGKSVLLRGPTSKELRAPTPYNTYVIKGLPPGPIANPGRETLAATAHPEKTNFLYFVAKTATPGDGHLFAATYAEHKRNVALYRQAVKNAVASDADDAETAKEELAAEDAQAVGDITQ